MRIGVSLGVNSLANDPGAARDIAQAAEELGYTRLVAADHVLGADPDRPGGWTGPYTHEHRWHEPFVLFGYMAALTERIDLMTGVIILPQRATALVAKQTAELDVLSGGRFVLGAGTGWNPVEYEALNRDFHTRGRQLDEQIELLRRLWTERTVTFEGRFHRVTQAGLKPMPNGDRGGLIPIWLGGNDRRALERVGRTGDGWYTLADDPATVAPALDRIREAARVAGRDPGDIGLQARVPAASGNLEQHVTKAQAWEAAGATHLMLGTDSTTDDAATHIAAMRAFAEAWKRQDA